MEGKTRKKAPNLVHVCAPSSLSFISNGVGWLAGWLAGLMSSGRVAARAAVRCSTRPLQPWHTCWDTYRSTYQDAMSCKGKVCSSMLLGQGSTSRGPSSAHDTPPLCAGLARSQLSQLFFHIFFFESSSGILFRFNGPHFFTRGCFICACTARLLLCRIQLFQRKESLLMRSFVSPYCPSVARFVDSR